ncbi:30S ribosomal protein S13 [candidate division WOR-1 bacterium RIFOXYA12_FULL_52_29]|uniref:Small ribosomal subunit protein uS13 n=1 Tax=candidate division WOR-1 bacterium RIFOXYC12_FULL_54_18 TaxID=1802584 RepID=A0A1F4T5B5_UNCSA|nr:MAG: 30S ribosomal protein S13 [candidate division WOR-1 bacterium RIFOXYA2_FULL_51_19]OGC17568.1 MAG: 30S ribosomal protein S13 [candidate division WOR-1 bacterium RIFOXYA12_FULL_52_29]OGC26425.1 MAG: 30S ribosomal protein S13 [candidate division WOR-1 bacterium RIFOXYB2_FULL_45_9]OGC27985.1 MAG: 30S ribosomal protein S13 [candidate division WOR-1 bacterium RIFOXYC12_FULL_54_18]OGC29729.1 MAG: 30S ribosomal protein S13 [candidate division WOR-1 bacterium RIFOXYB12_FULL_52_16]
MARLIGIDLPANKRLVIGLTYIYGIGEALSREILAKAKIDPNTKVKDMTDSEIVVIRDVLKDYRLEGDLRKDISMHIKRLIDIGSYRGSRHRKGLPVRGQRTRTNGRTRRGKRKTVGLGKKKEEKT